MKKEAASRRIKHCLFIEPCGWNIKCLGGGIRRLARKVGKSKATKDRSVKLRSVNVSH
jgi:hypothetical protein